MPTRRAPVRQGRSRPVRQARGRADSVLSQRRCAGERPSRPGEPESRSSLLSSRSRFGAGRLSGPLRCDQRPRQRSTNPNLHETSFSSGGHVSSRDYPPIARLNIFFLRARIGRYGRRTALLVLLVLSRSLVRAVLALRLAHALVALGAAVLEALVAGGDRFGKELRARRREVSRTVEQLVLRVLADEEAVLCRQDGRYRQ